MSLQNALIVEDHCLQENLSEDQGDQSISTSKVLKKHPNTPPQKYGIR
ncbi:hypothetical protein JNB11_01190 [Kocuria palustris]|nr:hypothetical protein [Kocuria palustris]